MSLKVFVPVLVAGITAVTLAVVTRAQDPLPTVFRAGVDVVHVDVSVLDKNRRPVRGLTAADFEVLEDGQPREIVAFTAVELPPPAPPRTRRDEASWVRDVPADVASNVIAPEGRVVVIFFGGVPFANFPIAQRIARETIEAMGPGDLGAIVFQTTFYNAKAVHDFTSDKARLLEAVNQPFSVATVPPDCRFCCLYDKSGLIADALSTIRGRRKSIVYIGPPDEPPPPCMEMARAAVRRLRAANVTMHEIDLAGVMAPSLGLAGPGTGGGLSLGRLQVLPGFLPLQTGGQTVQADNTPEQEVSTIFQESAAYYVIAFASTDKGPALGQTHDIAVRVSRPDVVVQARSTYQVGQTTRALEAEARKIPLVRSVDAAFPRTDLPLSLSVIPMAVPDSEQTTVAVALHVKSGSPAVEEASSGPAALPDERGLTLYVAAIDSVYATIAGSVTQKVELPAPIENAGRRDHELLARVDVPPGRYEIRAALDGTSGARASVYATVEVPMFGREPLSLSGVALSVSPPSPTSPEMLLAELLPVVPTARREFVGTDRVTAFVRIYQPDQEGQPVSVAASLTNTAGRVVFQTRRERIRSDFELELPVERLAPDEYMLAIEASSGKAKASRRVRFRIR
jgi:VWFA-related protein